MSPYISAKAYLRLIRQADFFQPLVTSITYSRCGLPDITLTIFYKAELNESSLTLNGYGISFTDELPLESCTIIQPEEVFFSAREFWCGAGEAIYADYKLNPDSEKQAEKNFGRLCWAASTQRKTKFDTFSVDLNDRLISVTFSLDLLNEMAAVADKKEAAKVTLTSTIPDSTLDRAPVGLKPTTGT